MFAPKDKLLPNENEDEEESNPRPDKLASPADTPNGPVSTPPKLELGLAALLVSELGWTFFASSLFLSNEKQFEFMIRTIIITTFIFLINIIDSLSLFLLFILIKINLTELQSQLKKRRTGNLIKVISINLYQTL